MSRLAEEFGISGNGLAKICDRLRIPYPPRGYWAKKDAGKPVTTRDLPPRPAGVPEWVDIHPTPPMPPAPPPIEFPPEAALAADVAVPETIDNLHPKIAAWLRQHEREQREREQENRRRKHDPWSFAKPLFEDLTPRDLYRFRVTSAICTAVERAGGKVADAPIRGKMVFVVSSHKVACTIVEKMVQQPVRPEGEAPKWSAYPEHHQSGLHSSGYLRVTIDTYLNRRQYQWIETSKVKISDLLGEIVGTIIAAGPILAEEQRRREESARQSREAEARRREAQRLRELDDGRWRQFRARAIDWEERGRLLEFVQELQRVLETEGDAEVGEKLISEWIEWARAKIAALDPLRNGAREFFKSL